MKLGMGGMIAQCEFCSPSLPRGLKKQGKFGSDMPAERKALYSCMRECDNGVDEPKSPPHFSNEIRTAFTITDNKNNLGLRAQPALEQERKI